MTTYYCRTVHVFLNISDFGLPTTQPVQIYGDDIITNCNVFSSLPDKVWTLGYPNRNPVPFTKIAGTSTYKLNQFTSKDFYLKQTWESTVYPPGEYWNPTQYDITGVFYDQLCNEFEKYKNNNYYDYDTSSFKEVGFGYYPSVNVVLFVVIVETDTYKEDVYFIPVFYQGDGAAGYSKTLTI